MTIPLFGFPSRHGAIDPALKRLLLLVMLIVLLVQLILNLFDFDYPLNDPYGKARAKIKLGKVDEAERIYRLQTISNPDDARSWLSLGDLLLRKQQEGAFTEAALDYQCAAFGLPGETISRISSRPEPLIALRQAGLLAAMRGQKALSQRFLQQATAGGDSTALRVLAMVSVISAAPGADQLLQQALIKRPGDIALSYCVAVGWQLHGHAERAEKLLTGVGPRLTDPVGFDHWASYCHARYLGACGDFAAAARELTQAQGVDATHVEGVVSLDRSQVAGDRCFQKPTPELAAVIQAWPEHAPWQQEMSQLSAPTSSSASNPGSGSGR